MQMGKASMIPVNPFDPRARPDPYPVYQYMRTVEPVHRSQLGFWVLTRYEDCVAVLEDKRWSHDADLILEPGRAAADPVDPTVRVLRSSIAFSDPPDHARHRRRLEPVVRSRMKNLDAATRKAAEGLIKLLRDKESSADLIRDYAAPLAMVVISDLLGVPSADRPKIQRWVRELAGGLDPAAGARNISRASGGAVAMVEYFLNRLDASPDGTAGIIRDLATRHGKLSSWELVADLIALMVIGVETASGLIGNGMLALLRHKDQMDEFRSGRAVLERALDELIRFDGPIHLTARVAQEDVQMGETRVAEGEQAIVLLAAANRDPARFSDPDRLDLNRRENPHIGFGAGAHACFAAPLAKILAGSAIKSLLSAPIEFQLSGDPVWTNTVTVRGMNSLPVALVR